MAERVAIFGSRSWTNKTPIVEYIKGLSWDTTVITGGALGVDRIAEAAARYRGLEVIVYTPDWSLGIHAGLLRNTSIVEASDRGVAFWDGESSGTQDTLKKFKAAGKPYRVFLPADFEDSFQLELWREK